MIKTDILIIGAGPTGLFAVFEAGLLQLKCHLIDALPQAGGQCSEIYPKKPIYDIPGFPEVLAGELVDNLMEQIKPFAPGFTLGERAQTIEKQEDGSFIVTTNKGTKHQAPIVAIAGGLGSFEPRKPLLENLKKYEDNGVSYMIKDPEVYRDRRVVIAGGGDSALDWSIFLADVASEVTLVHRRNEFRGALDSVEKVQTLKNEGKIRLITPAEVTALHGDAKLEALTIRKKTVSGKPVGASSTGVTGGGETGLNNSNAQTGDAKVKAAKANDVQTKDAAIKGIQTKDGKVQHPGVEDIQIQLDDFIPLFGLSPKLGPIADWGLDIEKNAIKVNTFDYQTNVPGIYAIGDVNTYPGKLKLILCGFHEATLMCQSAYQRIHPDKRYVMKYTTVGGVTGFDGSKKEAPKAVVKTIE